MLIANATIAVLKACPATLPNLDTGGRDGAGTLFTVITSDYSLTVHYKTNTVQNQHINTHS